MSKKEEFCIMPSSSFYSIKRHQGLERHEVFEGRTGNRPKSIEDGLVVFITPEAHRTGKHSIHKNPANWEWLKKLGQQAYMDYYNKTKEDFFKRYGRNYL